jgi:hypothetical protein
MHRQALKPLSFASLGFSCAIQAFATQIGKVTMSFHSATLLPTFLTDIGVTQRHGGCHIQKCCLFTHSVFTFSALGRKSNSAFYISAQYSTFS